MLTTSGLSTIINFNRDLVHTTVDLHTNYKVHPSFTFAVIISDSAKQINPGDNSPSYIYLGGGGGI